MKKIFFFLLTIPLLTLAQPVSKASLISDQNYTSYFEEAYRDFPNIPHGVLEAVSYSNTHIFHLVHDTGELENCMGLPLAYGVMGLTLDGKNYFRNNLVYVSKLSGIAIELIKNDPKQNILAYAKAFSSVLNTIESKNKIDTKISDNIFNAFIELSELPYENEGQLFALNTQLYSYFTFLNSTEFQEKYNFPNHNFDLPSLFGEENYIVLSSEHVTVNEEIISDDNGNSYKSIGNNTPEIQSTDYSNAIWNPAAACNYSSRGQAITGIVIHDVEGSYASCISWFKNCASNVSAHYVIRSSDGQITQMVLESNKAWHVGNSNPFTIGIEHEGYNTQTGWYTAAMYQSSANLVKDICTSGYGINPTTCWSGVSCNGSCVLPLTVKIKGHQHYPNQTHNDPGINWNWSTYYNLINAAGACGSPSSLSASAITLNSATINWNLIPTATSYNIKYKAFADTTWITLTSSSNHLALTGLTPSTSYQFNVQAECSSPSSYSNISMFTTSSSAPVNNTITIGTSTSPYSAHPFGKVYMDERVQYIFKKAELTSAGWTASYPYIKSISFYVSTASPQSMANFNISIAHTSNSTFANTTFLSGTNSTLVYNATATNVQGWNTFTFSSPFQYDGSSNLLISICWDNSSFTVNSPVFATSYPTFLALYYRADLTNSAVCNKNTGTQSYYRPNSKIEFSSSTSFPFALAPENRNLNNAIASISEDYWEIFPNPLNGSIINGKMLETENKIISLKIYDLFGRELIAKEVIMEEGNFVFSFDEIKLSTGVYMLVGLADFKRFTKIIIVK